MSLVALQVWMSNSKIIYLYLHTHIETIEVTGLR